jgi:hypothetical protein
MVLGLSTVCLAMANRDAGMADGGNDDLETVEWLNDSRVCKHSLETSLRDDGSVAQGGRGPLLLDADAPSWIHDGSN